MVLNRCDEIRHPCFVPEFRGNDTVPLTVGFSLVPFMGLRKFPFILSLLRIFIINGCQILSDTFCVSIEMIL